MDLLEHTEKAVFLERPNRFNMVYRLNKEVVRKANDRGSYLLILRLPKRVTGEIGKLGEVVFKEGYYIYVGSARKNLSGRIQRHKRLQKKLFWHIDYLRAIAEFHAALPVRTEDRLECEITHAVKGIADWEVPRFGSSDCSCNSHLFGMLKNPLQSAAFISLLTYFGADRLIGE